MSLHEVRVIRLDRIEPHDNADTLEVAHIWGYTSCIRIGDFALGDLAAFLEPDTLIPDTVPEVAFLSKGSVNGMIRIKAIRLRGIQSFGLLIKARPGWADGDNVFDELNCAHYEPPIKLIMNSANEKAPTVEHVIYDVESMRKFSNVIQSGEEVWISEKIHGANARYVFHDGRLWCGSRTGWKRADKNNIWWRAAENYNLEQKLAAYPDCVFYGEVYGAVQNFRYGAAPAELRLAFFDILEGGDWKGVTEVLGILNEIDLPSVPELYQGPWTPELVTLADGMSTVEGADHIREGCVVKTMTPQYHQDCGRTILKLVSVDYLAGKKK